MSSKFTKEDLNKIIVESIVDSMNYNNKQAIGRVRETSWKPYQTYFERYSNNKSQILKSAGIEESTLPLNANIENLLVAKQIIDDFRNKPELSTVQNYYLEGVIQIDPSGPHTTLKIIEEKLLKYNGLETILNIKPMHKEPIGKGYTVDIPSQYNREPVRARNLVQGLKFVGDTIDSAYEHIKQQEVYLKELQTKNSKPKMS
ncbi:hypothetical protein [Pseudomonas syringae]|uniref:Uncharacterized protein n=1 Tax=Pseudomonas syringae TaxID=317 RepID=A0A085VEZ8_PSESX|nr:hypothetical protein [Pseudomonas syringae]KFE54011.1 hypothetical protein IV02_04495 [Pseudomonas syringae]